MERLVDEDDQQDDRRPLRPFDLDSTLVDSSSGAAGSDDAPLDIRILRVIESIPDRTIRPGRLALELGISVEDASAELCGLLAAVGGGPDGASFRFERLPIPQDSSSEQSLSATTMVFTFPSNFQRRALQKRRKENLRAVLQRVFLVVCKALKVVVAFGLVLSLVILTLAAAVGVVAAMVAVSRGDGGSRNRSVLWNQLRALFYTVRQLLWCFAVFGPSVEQDDGSQDPFFKEVAYDLWLCCSVCCGNPGSIFFWMRANQLHHRRGRVGRSWGQAGRYVEDGRTAATSFFQESSADVVMYNGQPRRGLLSSLVEFLFGPTPFAPRPSTADAWMLRSAALVHLSTRNQTMGSTVSLEEIAPYIDFPPDSFNDSARIVEQGLIIVSHFHGIPAHEQTSVNESILSSEDSECAAPYKARFRFPELFSESATVKHYEHVDENDDGSWATLLYANPEAIAGQKKSDVPPYLKEERYKFTTLSQKQLFHCLSLGALNLFGVYWLAYSISPGGFVQLAPGSPLEVFLLSWLLPVLKFYALLYFALPGLRLLLILGLNRTRRQRNTRRALLVPRTLGSPRD